MVDGAEDLFRIQLRERQNPDPRVRALIQRFRRRWVATFAHILQMRTASPSVELDLDARLIASLTYGVLADYLDTPRDQRAALRTTLLDALPRFVLGGVSGLDTALAAHRAGPS